MTWQLIKYSWQHDDGRFLFITSDTCMGKPIVNDFTEYPFSFSKFVPRSLDDDEVTITKEWSPSGWAEEIVFWMKESGFEYDIAWVNLGDFSAPYREPALIILPDNAGEFLLRWR